MLAMRRGEKEGILGFEIEADDEALIKNWLDYWNEFPDLAVGKQLFIFLCVKYQNTAGIPFYAMLRKRQYTKRNDQARRFMKQLKHDAYRNLHVVLLSELCTVPHEEMDEWLENYAPTHCDREKLKEKVNDHFKKHKMNGIPTSDLAKALRLFLKET